MKLRKTKPKVRLIVQKRSPQDGARLHMPGCTPVLSYSRHRGWYEVRALI